MRLRKVTGNAARVPCMCGCGGYVPKSDTIKVAIDLDMANGYRTYLWAHRPSVNPMPPVEVKSHYHVRVLRGPGGTDEVVELARGDTVALPNGACVPVRRVLTDGVRTWAEIELKGDE